MRGEGAGRGCGGEGAGGGAVARRVEGKGRRRRRRRHLPPAARARLHPRVELGRQFVHVHARRALAVATGLCTDEGGQRRGGLAWRRLAERAVDAVEADIAVAPVAHARAAAAAPVQAVPPLARECGALAARPAEAGVAQAAAPRAGSRGALRRLGRRPDATALALLDRRGLGALEVRLPVLLVGVQPPLAPLRPDPAHDAAVPLVHDVALAHAHQSQRLALHQALAAHRRVRARVVDDTRRRARLLEADGRRAHREERPRAVRAAHERRAVAAAEIPVAHAVLLASGGAGPAQRTRRRRRRWR